MHVSSPLALGLLKQDPVVSVKYYEDRYGLKLVDVYHTPTLGKTSYYLASLRDGEGETWPVPGTTEVSGSLIGSRHCPHLVKSHRWTTLVPMHFVKARGINVHSCCYIHSWSRVSSLCSSERSDSVDVGVYLYLQKAPARSRQSFIAREPSRGALSWPCGVMCLGRYLTNAPGH